MTGLWLARIATLIVAFASLTDVSVVGNQQTENNDVLLKVTVTDGASDYLSALGTSDFHVFEDGPLRIAGSLVVRGSGV